MTLFAALVVAFVTIGFQAHDPLVGTYGCQGMGVDGKPYSIDLAIEAKGKNYLLTWKKVDAVASVGVGMLKGDTLAVYFETADSRGIAHYTVGKASLTGWWAPLGDEGQWPEVCVVGGQPLTV